MILLFIVMLIAFVYGDLDSGFPGGFFNYGDKNNDGRIDQQDIHKNLNMAWLMEWHKLVKNFSEPGNKEKAITKIDFLNLLNMPGTLQVTSKTITISYDINMVERIY